MYSKRRFYFLAIAEELNITRAARAIHVSQPSLTQYLNRLEETLDIKLVDRSYTPLRLTEAGKLYYDYLKESYRADQALMERLKLLRRGAAQPLRIGMPLQLDNALTGSLLPEFIRAHPEIDLSIWEGTTLTCEERLEESRLDICFGHVAPGMNLALPRPIHYEEFVIRPLAEEKLFIVCNAENPVARGVETSLECTLRVEPAALSRQTMYRMDESYIIFHIARKTLETAGVRPAGYIPMSSMHGILRAITGNKGSGFAFMPSYILNFPPPDVDLRKLAILRLTEEDLPWQFAMMRRKDRPLSREGQQFWRAISEGWPRSAGT